jgi:hypothetical protein
METISNVHPLSVPAPTLAPDDAALMEAIVEWAGIEVRWLAGISVMPAGDAIAFERAVVTILAHREGRITTLKDIRKALWLIDGLFVARTRRPPTVLQFPGNATTRSTPCEKHV